MPYVIGSSDDETGTIVLIVCIAALAIGGALLFISCFVFWLCCLCGPRPLREKCFECLEKLAPEDEEPMVEKLEQEAEEMHKKLA